MSGKIIFSLFCFAFGLGTVPVVAAQASKAAPIDLRQEIGLFAANQDGKFRLSIKNAGLKPGQEVTLIRTRVEGEPSKPEVRRARIVAKLVVPCDEINRGADDSTYQLEAGKIAKELVYFAVVGRQGDPKIVRNQVKGRLGTRGDITFYACTSSEGLHFIVWSGTPPRENRLWHRYYYLGYDVEPSCPDRDFEEDSH